MLINLVRSHATPSWTLGQIYVGGEFFCYTLEDVVRPDGEEKVYGQTAIPEGLYEVRVTWSPRFKTNLPLLIDVPGYSGVRIHAGNSTDDTEGCILVGESWDISTGKLARSRAALDRLLGVLDSVGADELVTIQIGGLLETQP